MKTFNVALIGGGVISKAHIGAAKASEGRIQVVAIVDPAEPARRAVSEATGATPFTSVEELFAPGSPVKPHGLVICTPPSVRIPIVKMALERGVAVLLEKPLAHNLTDSRELVELARTYSNVPTAVGYCHRFVPAVLEMKRQLESGELGQLVRFENTFACWFPAMRDRWMSDPRVSGGGSFIDTGCHSLDLFRFLVGDGAIAAAVFRKEWIGRGEANATVLLNSARGAGIISSGWAEPVRFVLSLVGTRGMLTYDYEKPLELSHKPSEGSPRTLRVETHETRFDQQLLAFSQLIDGSNDRGGMASFEDGLKVAELVDAAQRLAIVI